MAKKNEKKKELSPDQKRSILAYYVESLLKSGYMIGDVMGRPLNYFDYGAVIEQTNEIRKNNNLDPVLWNELLKSNN